MDGRAGEFGHRVERWPREPLRFGGVAARLSLRPLREVRDANEGGLTLLQPEAVSATAEVRGVSYVGRYGIRIEWADGHDHGIYTFEFFRALDAGG